MGKSSPSAPAAPDPAATAAAQSGANINTAAAQAALNNTNQYTPYGSTTYDQTGSYTTPSGETVPTWTQNSALSPLGQEILTGTQGIQQQLIAPGQRLAQQADAANATQLNFATPFAPDIVAGPSKIGAGAQNVATQGILDWNPYEMNSLDDAYSGTINAGQNKLQQLDPAYAQMLGQSPQLLNQSVTDAIYGQQKSFLDPQWNQQATKLEDQLSRQGIPVGSEAYNNALEQMNNSRTQAYQSAQDSAIGQGTAAANNLYGMALQGQQQATGRTQAGYNAALQAQQQLAAQQQAAFGTALEGQQYRTGQAQNQFQAALQGQQQSIAQQQLQRQFPLTQLQALLGVTPGAPQQPIASPSQTPIGATDYTGAQALQQQALNTNYQGQVATQNANSGAMAGLAGAGIAAGAVLI